MFMLKAAPCVLEQALHRPQAMYLLCLFASASWLDVRIPQWLLSEHQVAPCTFISAVPQSSRVRQFP